MPLRSLFPALTLAVLVLGGCTYTRLYEGHDPGQVWTAMIAVAETPDYDSGPAADRWTVRTNEVWIDETTSRLEIFRELDRLVTEPGQTPRKEDRTWRLQIWLDSAPPPLITFVSRTNGWPSTIATESDRYFDDVARLLGSPRGPAPPTSAPAPAVSAPLPPPTPAPAPPDPDAPPVDIDDLLDG